jgi:hypothetical protein
LFEATDTLIATAAVTSRLLRLSKLAQKAAGGGR